MLINELTDLDCEACGEIVALQVDLPLARPLLCERCLTQLLEDEVRDRELIAAA